MGIHVSGGNSTCARFMFGSTPTLAPSVCPSVRKPTSAHPYALAQHRRRRRPIAFVPFRFISCSLSTRKRDYECAIIVEIAVQYASEHNTSTVYILNNYASTVVDVEATAAGAAATTHRLHRL